MSRRLMFRMIAPVAAISALLLVLGGAAAWYVHRLQKNVSDVLALNVASVRAAEELEIGILEARGLLKDYLYTGRPEHLQAIRAGRGQTDRWLREAERLATSPHEQRLIARVKQAYERFHREVDRRSEGAPEGSRSDLARAEEILTREFLQPAHEYLDYNEQMALRHSRQNQATARLMVLALLLLGTCGSVAGLVAGYGIARGIARSIGQLSQPIRDAAGKLNEAVTGPSPPASADDADSRAESGRPPEHGQDLQDLEASLREVAVRAGTVVERLHESQREVLRAEQLAAVGQLAAGLAHELRNPLMSMKVLVQPAAEGHGGGASSSSAELGLSQRDLEVLNEEIGRLEGLIQTFLDFARPPQPEKRPFELQDVLGQMVLLVSARGGQLGVRVERAAAGGAVEPVVIEADVGQVRQVFLNLLLNALEATPEGGTVTLRVQRHRGWVAVQVADTGRGLPAELGPRIFEPFVSTKETGLGLGLSICKRIAEAHGGELTAADRPEGGAVFTLRLPLSSSSSSSSSSCGSVPTVAVAAAETKEAGHADFAHRR